MRGLAGSVIALAAPAMAKAGSLCGRPQLRFSLRKQGFEVGRMMLSLEPAVAETRVRIEVESTGPVAWITGYEGWWQSLASHEEHNVAPVRFRSFYSTRRYDRRIEIDYADGGGIQRLRTWKRDVPQTSKVPPALQRGTIDPLTWILRVRDWLDHPAGEAPPPETSAIFDGRRRFDFTTTSLGRGEAWIVGRRRPVERVRADMTILAGFDDDDEVVNWLRRGDDRWIELLLSTTPARIPLGLKTIGGSFDYEIVATKLDDVAC
jgi:hypothetical protein